jgi:hypothetical protein
MVVYLPSQKMFLSTIFTMQFLYSNNTFSFYPKKTHFHIGKAGRKAMQIMMLRRKIITGFYASPLNPNFECWVSKDILIKAIITMNSLPGDFLVQNSENFVILLYFLVC